VIRLLVAVILVAAGASAHANTRRIAVVVGNNTGNAGKTPLHFAETDATRLARVFGELGGVAPADLFVLRGRTLGVLRDTFAFVTQQITKSRSNPANRVVVLFYFSGHSDGEALELGRERLTFSELRRSLAALGADVRVALIDSCRSGGLLEAKGGALGPAFQIRMTDELASSGEALLTSSASNEIALESREITGSVFTHHLISGLRGAADASGDGLVTLTEAYQYAYAHTIKSTGETFIGTQHPAYDYRLSGQGELVLSDLGKRTASLELPRGFERIIVIDGARDQVVAEVTSDTHTQIAVQAGRYAIHASRDGKLFAGEVVVVVGRPRVVAVDELATVPVSRTTSKGGLPGARSGELVVASGAATGVAEGLGLVPTVRVELVMPAGLSLALDTGSRAGAGFRETSMAVLAGYRHTIGREGWRAWAGLEVGGGAVLQSEAKATAYSGMFAVAVAAGILRRLSPRLSVAVALELPMEIMKRDRHVALVAVPTGWLGLAVRL